MPSLQFSGTVSKWKTKYELIKRFVDRLFEINCSDSNNNSSLALDFIALVGMGNAGARLPRVHFFCFGSGHRHDTVGDHDEDESRELRVFCIIVCYLLDSAFRWGFMEGLKGDEIVYGFIQQCNPPEMWWDERRIENAQSNASWLVWGWRTDVYFEYYGNTARVSLMKL